jgi:magnesium-transporting ATPase (P-type)
MLDKAPWEEKGANLLMKNFEIAMTGNAFQIMSDKINNPDVSSKTRDEYKRIIAHAKIYARMSPDHKAMLVASLQENTDFMIGMCGDGAND